MFLTETNELIGLMFVLSLIQSVFGIGILVFGTPTLLLAGYGFNDTLLLLLPASITVSITQVVSARDKLFMSRGLTVYTLPLVGFGLWIMIIDVFSLDVRLLVGVMMLFAGGLRFSPAMQKFARSQIVTRPRIYLSLMGFVHGLTNMGGALLTVMMGTLFQQKGKLTIRTNIAVGYLLFGIVQICVLLVFQDRPVPLNALWMVITAFLSYVFIGMRIFHKVSNDSFNQLLTVFIFVYGVLLVGQFFLSQYV